MFFSKRLRYTTLKRKKEKWILFRRFEANRRKKKRIAFTKCACNKRVYAKCWLKWKYTTVDWLGHGNGLRLWIGILMNRAYDVPLFF